MKTVFRIFVMVMIITALACTMVACFKTEHVHKVSTTNMVSKEATCSTPGEGYMYCVECGEKLNTVVIPATGKHNVKTIVGYAATCNKAGLTDGEMCKDCGTVIKEQCTIPATNTHNPIIVPGYSATCSNTGLTDGSKCKDCNTVLTEQTVIAVNNVHVNTEEILGYEATCSTPGLSNGVKCNDCGATVVEQTILPTNDNHINTEEILGYEATCSTPGLSNGVKCNDCNKVIVNPETLPVNNNHTAIPMSDILPTCSSVGYTGGEKCKECGIVLTQPTEIPTTEHTPGDWIQGVEVSYANFGESNLICANCPAILDTKLTPPLVTDGLEYTLNADETGYILTGRGTNKQPYINIASTYLNLPVVGIANEAFADDLYILSVYVPENIEYIGSEAFSNCANIETIYLPITLKTIGNSAFYGCFNLMQLTLPGGLTEVGDSAFENCDNLTTLTVESKNITFGSKCFASCDVLTTLNVYSDINPLNITLDSDMDNVAFANCNSLRTINFIDNEMPDISNANILNDISTICRIAHAGLEESGCLYLGSDNNKYAYLIGVTNYSNTVYAIQDGTMYIGPNAFINCSFVESVYVPAGVLYIANNAFPNMDLLYELTLPDTIVYIASDAFENSWPKKITFKGTREQWYAIPGTEHFDDYRNEKIFN